MTPQKRVVALAKSQVGYHPTHGKFNRYAEALDKTDLYNGGSRPDMWCKRGWVTRTNIGSELTGE